jgi:hypothetical protein
MPEETSRRSFDHLTNQEQQESSRENERLSTEQWRKRERIFSTLYRSTDDLMHLGTANQTRERQRGLSRSLSESAISSSRTNDVDPSEREDLRHEDHSLPQAREGKSPVSETKELRQLSGPRMDNRLQLGRQEARRPRQRRQEQWWPSEILCGCLSTFGEGYLNCGQGIIELSRMVYLPPRIPLLVKTMRYVQENWQILQNEWPRIQQGLQQRIQGMHHLMERNPLIQPDAVLGETSLGRPPRNSSDSREDTSETAWSTGQKPAASAEVASARDEGPLSHYDSDDSADSQQLIRRPRRRQSASAALAEPLLRPESPEAGDHAESDRSTQYTQEYHSDGDE